jgi:Co/Zn/Cd efflux system component
MAFVANAVCLWLLFQYKRGDINIRSAWVCSRNDMVANVGVITAGGLVLYSGSQWPDYLIGAAVALFVLVTSLQVITDSVSELKLSK